MCGIRAPAAFAFAIQTPFSTARACVRRSYTIGVEFAAALMGARVKASASDGEEGKVLVTVHWK